MADKDFTAIKKLQSLPDPLLTFKWSATFLPFGLPPEYLESVSLGFLNLRAKDGFFQAGTYTYSADFHEPTPINCTFYEDQHTTTMRWIHGWKQMIKDFRSGVYGLPSNYKQSISVQLLDNENTTVLSATMKGCWPSETNAIELNYESSERIKISQAFSVDDVELDFASTKGSLGGPALDFGSFT